MCNFALIGIDQAPHLKGRIRICLDDACRAFEVRTPDGAWVRCGTMSDFHQCDYNEFCDALGIDPKKVTKLKPIVL